MCFRAPADAPHVDAPAAHGLQTPSITPVMQRVGVAMIVVVAAPLDQPIAMRDKMVMCTELELEDAFRDYRLQSFACLLMYWAL